MRALALAAFCVVFLTGGAFGQAGLGSISGTVVDSTDAVVPNATVKVVQLSTNSERVTVTNEAGIFNMPSLVASTYKLTITAPGFREKELPNLVLNAFQTMTLGRIALEIGSGPSTIVNVTAEQQMMVTENAVRSETIQSKQVTDMPLQGRNWSTLLKIIPGSTPRNTNAMNGREAGYDGYGDFRINGKASNQTQVNLDGGSNVDHGSDTKTTVTPSLEAIQEVSVLTNNFQAEYGIRAGTIVNIVTKSGTNSFHGTAWDYIRNEALNARPWADAFFGRPKPRYRYNYFGGNLGGPIRKDKLFFFANYENLKQDTPTITQQIRVPTELERKGDFSQTINADGTRPTIYLPGTQASGNPQLLPGNVIPPSLISPIGQAIMNLYPLPNLKNETNNNYLNQYAKEDKRHLGVAKVDWNINDSTRAYLRFNYDFQYYRDLVTWAAGSNLPFVVTGWDRPDKALTGNVTKTFSSTLVAETLFNWQKDFVNAPLEVSKDAAKISRAAAGLKDIPLAFPVATDILPEISGTGYQDFQFNRFPWYAKAPEYQLASTWTWTRGTHVFKWGGQYILNKKDEINQAIEKGSFNFGVNTSSNFDLGYAPANLITGAVSQFRQVSSPSHKLSKYQDLHLFVQDTWKITPRLTLDYGLRLYHIPSERNTDRSITMDAVFVPGLWNPARAPRYYVPDPTNTRRLIDPAKPNEPLPTNVFSALLFSLVPGSGDPMNGVVPLGSSAIGEAGIRNPNAVLLAPRGGFAWQFLNRTVLRGGFGWSYNRPTIGQATGTFQNGLADQVDYRQTSLSTLTGTTVRRVSPLSFGAIDESSNAVPTVYDFSLSVQRELPFGAVLDVAWIGNIQRHQTMQFNINQVLPGTAWKPEFIDPRLAGNNFAGPVSASNPGPLPGTQAVDSNLMRPFRGFNALNLITNVGNARYNSLQWSINKRYSRGLTFQLVHTWGKLLTGTENVGPFYYRWKDYTGFIANEDRVHVVGINYTYELPRLSSWLRMGNIVGRQILDGWGIAHLMNFYSGRPLTPSFGLQYANNTQGVANINSIFTGSPDIGPRIQPLANPNNGIAAIDRTYDVTPFGMPQIPDVGMGSRNYLWSPGTFSNDINVSKMFSIREGKGLELRASFFNPFNQVRRQDLNTSHTFKMRGAAVANGYYLFNSPEQQTANLVSRVPNSTEAEKYNQYRNGVGHMNVTSVLDMRRIEIGLRFKF
ncbi:MAG TPA: carboxypeptidase regulatory-like domain-containing protein [Bryobacteraceae bacterium]|nr:carboxypeptidase regulatory-like domain-containing protein [Bryobacteraceae bacterium]